MTVPFLANCPHMTDAWCLSCTSELGHQYWAALAERDARESALGRVRNYANASMDGEHRGKILRYAEIYQDRAKAPPTAQTGVKGSVLPTTESVGGLAHLTGLSRTSAGGE